MASENTADRNDKKNKPLDDVVTSAVGPYLQDQDRPYFPPGST
jgi:hypothetical protein